MRTLWSGGVLAASQMMISSYKFDTQSYYSHSCQIHVHIYYLYVYCACDDQNHILLQAYGPEIGNEVAPPKGLKGQVSTARR